MQLDRNTISILINIETVIIVFLILISSLSLLSE